jgi:hypothetical protein
MRKQIPKLCTVLVTAAFVFGLALVAPAVMPALVPSMTPVANADPLPNGYDVTCKGNGGNTICQISGCPRIYEDYAGDVVHVRINGVGDDEKGKACGDTLNYTVGIPGDTGFTLSMQGCRKHDLSKDDCGPFSDYAYKPAPKPVEAPQPVPCPAGSPTPTVIPPAQCAPAPAPPVTCPPDSPVREVPAGQTCPATPPPPQDSVTLNFARAGLGLNATFKNNSKVAGQCQYNAEPAGGTALGGKSDNFPIGANASVTRNYAGPPLGSTYHITLSCTGDFNGQNVTFGSIDRNDNF